MKKKIIAHFTDTHLGQRLVVGGEMAGDKMHYDNASGEHEAHLRQVLDNIASKNISEVIFGGDIGHEEAVEGFFEILGGYEFSASIVLGNHDHLSDISRYWNAGFDTVEGKMCSSQDDGFMKRIFLDTSDNTIGVRQMVWLARELDRTGKAALFLHHPILAIDTPLERSGVALEDRREIMALLTGIDCEISVFSGHYHMADEAKEANVRQYATPAVSYQIAKQSVRMHVDTHTFGYRILEFSQTGVETEIVLLTEVS